MTIEALDTADPRRFAAQVAAHKVQGVKNVIVYINPLGLAGDKTAKKPTIDILHAAGMNVGFVSEGWGGSNNFSHGDINGSTGAHDGTVCGGWLDQLGAPAGTAVYPTVDNDVNQSQLTNLCMPYFMAFRRALDPKYKMGAYGCGTLLSALDAAGLLDYRWLSNAMGWSGSRAYRDAKKWDILQQLPAHVAGIDTDPDVLNPAKTEFGFWKAPTGIMDINSNVAGA